MMRRPNVIGLISLLGGMSLLAGCVLWTVGLGARDDVDGDSELVFSHDRHARMDIQCAEYELFRSTAERAKDALPTVLLAPSWGESSILDRMGSYLIA